MKTTVSFTVLISTQQNKYIWKREKSILEHTDQIVTIVEWRYLWKCRRHLSADCVADFVILWCFRFQIPIVLWWYILFNGRMARWYLYHLMLVVRKVCFVRRAAQLFLSKIVTIVVYIHLDYLDRCVWVKNWTFSMINWVSLKNNEYNSSYFFNSNCNKRETI